MTDKSPWEDDPGEFSQGGKVMTLWQHLDELRQRMIYSLIIVAIFFAVAMYFSNEIIAFLKLPLSRALPSETQVLHFTGPFEVFLTSIKVGFLTAVVCACPFWIYQFWRFIEPALYKNERRYILPFITASIALFLAGISFSYFLILPMTLDFLLTIGMEVGKPMITVTDYISMVMFLIFGFGLVFEAPLILILLAMLDLFTAADLAGLRRHVAVAVLIIAAIMTPPDPISQIAMAIPLYIMFEISILIIRAIKK
jgi:sec-independent protein translocase protein TatC